MVKRTEGVSVRLIESAKSEFLAQGYNEASLRSIASKADTSTNSIYVRFGDKAGLFDAIVQPVVEGLFDMASKGMTQFRSDRLDMSFDDMFEYKTKVIVSFMDYVYDYFDEFKLLLCQSPQGEADRFIARLVEADVDLTKVYIENQNSIAFQSGQVTVEFIQLLTVTYYNGFFEPVRLDMDRESANAFVRQLRRFFFCGYRDIITG